jgi:hypothetical protein
LIYLFHFSDLSILAGHSELLTQQSVDIPTHSL